MNETEVTGSTGDNAKRRIAPAAAVAAVVAILGILLLLGWYFLRDRGNAGKPVPSPRSSMNEPGVVLSNETVTLSAEQARNAGITVESVGEQLSSESTETSSTGAIEPNAYKQIPAITLAGGIVRRVIPELGENVKAGQAVAVIFSDEFAQTQSRYLSLRTEAGNARLNYDRSLKLVALNAPGRAELQDAAKQRKAADAALIEMRSRYERTIRLISIGAASREELEQDNTKLRSAEAEAEQARSRESRAAELLPMAPEVKAASEDALNKLQTAESELAAARQRLLLYGMSPSRVNGLHSTSQITSELIVSAPVSGTVTSRNVNPGEVVEANKELFKVTDLTSVWVIAQIYESDLGRIRVGTGASISTDAFPDLLFRGAVSYIDPQLDEATRTGKVRVEVANQDRRLKIGMYVRAAFGSLGGAERTVPAIPTSAVQSIDEKQIVFVATADPNIFELRPVRLAPAANGRYAVLEGLSVGDRIVTNGSFELRAEWMRSKQNSAHQH